MLQGLVFAGIVVAICLWLLCYRNRPLQSSDPLGLSMIGLTGTATENISSHGSVSIRGELWRATCARGIIVKGEDVRVVALGEGLTLVVERVTK